VIIALIAILLIVFGLILIIKGLMIRSSEKVNIKAGGVVLIGPFPIIIGDIRMVAYLLILALVIILTLIVLSILIEIYL